MGKLLVVKFEETPNPDYYICKVCRAHIALSEDLHTVYMDCEFAGGVFKKAINLEVDGPDKHRQVGSSVVADSYCANCGRKLGFKYIQVSAEQTVVENNMVKFHFSKLLKRVGDQILDGLTEDPVPDQSP